LPRVTFEGAVFSGKGEGRKFISLPWVTSQIEAALGFTPFAGTLNIRLTEENAAKKRLLDEAEKFEIRPKEGYCTGFLLKAEINGMSCGVVLPQVPNYPTDELEIVAAPNLRERLGLRDGSTVSVDVTV